MGVPTTFVRFFACNLRCSWCDTKCSWSVREGGKWDMLSPQEVAERVRELGARHVVLTGGEPTLQKELAHLAGLLRQESYHLTVETNTTIFPSQLVPLIDLWSLSPKLSSAGENYLRYPIIERFLETLHPDQQQWKFASVTIATSSSCAHCCAATRHSQSSNCRSSCNRKAILRLQITRPRLSSWLSAFATLSGITTMCASYHRCISLFGEGDVGCS
jgi:organic radical activating enzyme